MAYSGRGGLGVCLHLRLTVPRLVTMENQVEKKLDNGMDTRDLRGLHFRI